MLSTHLHSIIIIVVVIVVVVVIVINSAGNSSSSNSGGGGSTIFRSRLLEVVVFLEVVGDLMHLCVCVYVIQNDKNNFPLNLHTSFHSS